MIGTGGCEIPPEHKNVQRHDRQKAKEHACLGACEMITAKGVCPSSRSACSAWRRLTACTESHTGPWTIRSSPRLGGIQSNLRFGLLFIALHLAHKQRPAWAPARFDTAHKGHIMRTAFLVSSRPLSLFSASGAENPGHKESHVVVERVSVRVTAAQPRKAHACLGHDNASYHRGSSPGKSFQTISISLPYLNGSIATLPSSHHTDSLFPPFYCIPSKRAKQTVPPPPLLFSLPRHTPPRGKKKSKRAPPSQMHKERKPTCIPPDCLFFPQR
ncbi:hypothetical protein V8C35DRAFT_138844 [Trichoderma chlorosporum]